MSTPTFVVVSGNYLRIDKIIGIVDNDDDGQTSIAMDNNVSVTVSIEDGMILRSLLDKAHELGEITLIEAGRDGSDGSGDCGEGQGSGCCGYGCGACDDDDDSGEDGCGTSPRDEGTDRHAEADSGRSKDDPQGKPKPELSSGTDQAGRVAFELERHFSQLFPWINSGRSPYTVRN